MIAVLGSVFISVAQTKQIQMTVSGLACPVCSYGLEKKLKQIDGVQNLYIELSTGKVTFDMSDGKTVTEEVLKQKVKDAGYTVKEIKYLDLPKK